MATPMISSCAKLQGRCYSMERRPVSADLRKGTKAVANRRGRFERELFSPGRGKTTRWLSSCFAQRDSERRCVVTNCAVAESASSSENAPMDVGSVVVIDNYDSFTYNLSQYLGELGCDHTVIYNDTRTVSEIKKMKPRGILISPGPGRPEDSGVSMDVIQELGQELPIMGVCMGLQCMAQVFGGVIIRSPYGVMHGRSSEVHHVDEGLLKGLPSPFVAARYHSLVIEKSSCPEELEITAWTEDGTIMGIRHKELRHLQAVQFHPESILTDYGKQIIQNFIDALEE